MNLIKLIFIGVLAVFFCSANANNSSPAAVELNQLLSNLHEFTADFKQHTYNTQHKLLQTSKGRLALLRPGNFRWETLSPMHQVLITNGKNLWVYDVDLEQVTQQKLQNQGELNPAQLLSGSLERLEQQFNITLDQSRHDQVFKLVPKAKDRTIAWIRFEFKNGELIDMQFANELGEINDFQFSHIQTRAHLKTSDFNFVAPKGVDVLVNS